MNTKNKTKGLVIVAILTFAATIFTACVPTPGGGSTNPNIIHKNWNLNITSKLNWNDTIFYYNLDVNNDNINDVKFNCNRSSRNYFGYQYLSHNIYVEGNNLEFAYDSILAENFNGFEDKSFYIVQNKSIIIPNISWTKSLGQGSGTFIGMVASAKAFSTGSTPTILNIKLKTNVDGTAYSGFRILKNGNYFYGWIKYQIVGLYIPNISTDISAKILETAISTEPNKIILAGQK